MKCPKCGYLGFETTDRCRNCQYDFSLAPFTTEPDLTLHGSDRHVESPSDFDLPTIKRATDKLSNTALDLDRLFGAPENRLAPEPPPVPITIEAPPEPVAIAPEPPVAIETTTIEAEPEPELQVEPEVAAPPYGGPEPDPDRDPNPDLVLDPPPDVISDPAPDRDSPPDPVLDPPPGAALPFDDAPILPPPAARTPLAVRRSTPEVPRNRPRTTRPVRMVSLNLEAASPNDAEAARAASETVASLMESPSAAVRVGAAMIDLLLLAGIDAAVLYLTLRVTGLQNSLDDMRVLPLIPFVGFLALIGFGYVAAFTVAGGQTIGKMVLSLRVIGDDGRPVDAAGGMLRALGCMLVPITLGLSYLPVLFASDHRALHDRLAGTRVVQE